jgi:2-octaprenyl-6-methoxyphenol hydroxylase
VSSPPTTGFDVVIVGGGMVGASLALALTATRLRVALIEAVAADSPEQPSFDDRSTALGNGARRILQTLGVWDEIAANAAPIREIHVSDAGRFGFARLCAADHGLSAFGFVVSNRTLGAALWRALTEAGRVSVLRPARVSSVEPGAQATALTVLPGEQRIQARLLVAADGAHSLIKQAVGVNSQQRSYQQLAVVANLTTDRAARGIAYERFTERGPIALLPRFDGGYTVVWSAPADGAAALCDGDEQLFGRELQQAFGWRAGRILTVGRRATYPLSLVQAETVVRGRVALIGNAAQSLHPVAAQGFNLGLRDVATLAELIAAAEDPGAEATLQDYERRRSTDRRGMVTFTDSLVKLFTTRRAAASTLRDLGLLLFDLSPVAKQALSRLSWGFGGALPRLSRGLTLLQ